MPMSPTVVCNNILKRAFTEGISVTPMKLQKLLYFVSCEYAKQARKELFSESFGVWQYGPVLRTVYDEFRSYGGSPIKSYAKDADGNSYAIDEDTAPNLKRAINRVWDTYKNYSGVALSKITHEDGSGWSHAYCQHRDRITYDDMRDDTTYVYQMPD
ncbi:hypothetical protein [Flavonifractor phage Chenonceau]|jgi:uncharacterized phage-associated protein|uniref:DUF4065 domain-containing protein n=1 Tax=Flavonifractor plautii TaxID=292800 RepID=A0AAX1KGI6_FLAPL|nr:type II toxin-antitoxin system antitoxin SocA domain-containing protein [Flavonifractor plautii]QQR04943.1 DUF4065 domain-containing protein [Flavonifractor plautii]UQA25744.1 DUF4065 domain-containing protein [Flavonifractor plautii]WAK79834.1 hypothetical protein [Flavonifractor phage Chenonceau]